MINVTKTTLPPLNTYNKYLRKIWENNWITNDGDFVKLLEKELQNYLETKNLLAVANGTMALQLAIKGLHLKGEVITTPFTFAATTTALLWEGLTPVFADIDPKTFNLDPADIKKKITKKTSAILAVHVYGNPCDIEELEKIARDNHLKLIFDAAHAFGVKYKGKSILEFGDVSTLSFHATKVFHTIEGGAIIAKNSKLFKELKLYRNFGIKSEEEVVLPGINAKMNEFEAVMGLCNLQLQNNKRKKRQIIHDRYINRLSNIGSIAFQKSTASYQNYSYMPILFKSKKNRDTVYKKLLDKGIGSRKYFYPLTSDYNFVRNNARLDNARRVSDGILCLPLYPQLKLSEVDRIVKLIKENS